MADVRCVQCGKLVSVGFLCDACQFARAQQPPTGNPYTASYSDPNADPVDMPRFNPIAIGAAVFVFALGLIAFLEMPKIEKSVFKPSADASASDSGDFASANTTTSTPSTGYAPPANSTQYRSAAVPRGPESSPPASPQQRGETIVVAVGRAVDASLTNGGFQSNAQVTLKPFLQDYCLKRANKVRQLVEVTKVVWLPGAVGVVVSIREGDTPHQGTAQYYEMGGWHWMVRPEDEKKDDQSNPG